MTCLKVLDRARYGGKTVSERKENANDNIYQLLTDRVIKQALLERNGPDGKMRLKDRILPFYTLYILAVCDMR